eukprot:9473639-Pyramimonas_sp.AAC.1
MGVLRPLGYSPLSSPPRQGGAGSPGRWQYRLQLQALGRGERLAVQPEAAEVEGESARQVLGEAMR